MKYPNQINLEVVRRKDKQPNELFLKYKSLSDKTINFEWGYGGGGPQTTAKVICKEIYGEYLGERVYYEFFQKYIKDLPREGFDGILDITDFNSEVVSHYLLYDVTIEVHSVKDLSKWELGKETPEIINYTVEKVAGTSPKDASNSLGLKIFTLPKADTRVKEVALAYIQLVVLSSSIS